MNEDPLKEINRGIKLPQKESSRTEENTWIHRELAAAKAEIKFLENNTKSNVILMTLNDELETETKRLRETIQRNEDKSVECERLREALEKIKNNEHRPGCDEHSRDYCLCTEEYAQAALDGYSKPSTINLDGGEQCKHKWTGQRLGGDPTEASSTEWVGYCDLCGIEGPPDGGKA